MKKIYIAILVLFAVFLAIGCSGSGSNSDNAQPEATSTNEPAANTETPAATPQAKAEAPVTPVVIATFTGSSTKDTETFSVPSDQFKISWDTKAGQFEGNFIFTIKNADGSFKAAGANVIGTNSESTVVRGAGDYYLSITATQPYTITVETM